jgi:hypothetical protein
MQGCRKMQKCAWIVLIGAGASCFSWEAPIYHGGSVAFGSDAIGQRTAIATWQWVEQDGRGGLFVDGRS